MKKVFLFFVICMLVSSLVFAGGGGGEVQKSGEITLRYTLYDQGQEPAYRQICAAFEAANPGVKVQIELVPISDYFTKIATQATSNSCPDVMTFDMQNLPTYQSRGVFADLTSYIKSSGVDLSKFNKNTLEQYTIDGKIYGLPKDFDAFALFYNQDLLTKAGHSSYPQGLTWNTRDGGTWVKFLQDLTLDNRGRHPYDPGFDPANVVQYGFNPSNRNDYTNLFMGTIIRENGGRYWNPETGALTFDEPKTAEALEFMWNLVNKWYVVPPTSVIQATGSEALFYAGKIGVWHGGPYMVGPVQKTANFKWAITRNMVGPSGQSTARINGLIDAVYDKSPNKELAWKLALFIATEGQPVLGNTGSILPGNSDYGHTYVDYFKTLGVDVQAFVDAYNGDVFFSPTMNEFTRADDIIRRQFAMAMDGTGKVPMSQCIANIMRETTGFLTAANRK